jgi:RecA-family ATPase
VSVFAGDLKDIELPVELEWQRDKSMTIKTESFNGGIWHYEGRVEPLSLKDYIINAMHNNKWKLVGESTSSDILLAFVKPNKTCMIVISDSKFGKTKLTLHVTIDRTSAAGLNPFGEAVGR